MGHLEGVTFLDSRGDGRYFISNGKDQSIKLWDIRRMSSDATRYAHIDTSHCFPEILFYFFTIKVTTLFM